MKILMPQLGETVTEGTISKWHKKVGDLVKKGEVLFEIETDKTSMEIPAISDGKISKISYKGRRNFIRWYSCSLYFRRK